MISFSNIELRRGIKLLLSDAELSIHPGQHIGVIGANGSGKSSLFKLLIGEISADAGELFIPSDWRIAHMAQELATSERSALDFVISKSPLSLFPGFVMIFICLPWNLDKAISNIFFWGICWLDTITRGQ